jgi:hypothetical protein
MDVKRLVEEKLGHAVSALANGTSISPTRVFVIRYSATREVLVTHHPSAETAVYFDGLYCPFAEATLLIERSVAADWGLMSHERS